MAATRTKRSPKAKPTEVPKSLHDAVSREVKPDAQIPVEKMQDGFTPSHGRR